MQDQFYDSLEEEIFSDCRSSMEISEKFCTPCSSKHIATYDQLRSESSASTLTPHFEPRSTPHLADVVPLYKRDTIKSELARNKHKTPIRKSINPTKNEKKRSSYLTLFYSKIKYPVVGSGDDHRSFEGSDTARAVRDPKSRINSAALSVQNEEICCHHSDEESSDEESFYQKFIAEQEVCKNAIKERSKSKAQSTSELIPNATERKHRKPRSKATSSVVSKTSLISDEQKEKLKQLHKRQLYGKNASTNNRIKSEEIQLIKHIKTKFAV